MPRKQHRKQGKRRGRSTRAQGGRIETVSGRAAVTAWQQVNSGTVQTGGAVFMNPYITTGSWTSLNTYGLVKLSQLAQLFQYWRFTKLRFRILPNAGVNLSVLTTQPIMIVLGYSPSVSAGVNSIDRQRVWALPWVTETVVLQADGGTVPSVPRWYSIPKAMLLGQPIKWWRTFPLPPSVPSGEILSDYIQGTVHVCMSFPDPGATTNIGFSLDWDYTIQFKDFYDGPSVALTDPQAARLQDLYSRAIPADADDEKSASGSEEEFTDVQLHRIAEASCGFGCMTRKIPCTHVVPPPSRLEHFSIRGDEPDAQFWAWVKQKEKEYRREVALVQRGVPKERDSDPEDKKVA